MTMIRKIFGWKLPKGALMLGIIIIIAFLYLRHHPGILDSLASPAFGDRRPLEHILIPGNACSLGPPKEKSIILRLDDVQAFAFNRIIMNITDTALDKNISVSLAVIPKDIDMDPVIKNYIMGKLNDTRVEIAQHGTNHAHNEFENLTGPEAYELSREGLEKIKRTFGVRPVTFIPPYAAYNENTVDAISMLGFKVLSSRRGEYLFGRGIIRLGYTAPTGTHHGKGLAPADEIISSCKESLELKNLCVILIHPQNYANEDKISLNETRYTGLVDLFEGLKKLNARFITFRDLVMC